MAEDKELFWRFFGAKSEKEKGKSRCLKFAKELDNLVKKVDNSSEYKDVLRAFVLPVFCFTGKRKLLTKRKELKKW